MMYAQLILINHNNIKNQVWTFRLSIKIYESWKTDYIFDKK